MVALNGNATTKFHFDKAEHNKSYNGKRTEYFKNYYQSHKEKKNKASLLWWKNNKEKHNLSRRKWYKKNKKAYRLTRKAKDAGIKLSIAEARRIIENG